MDNQDIRSSGISHFSHRLLRHLLGATALALALVAVGCSEGGIETRIGIATLMTHPALSEIETGFKERMAELGYVEGETVEYVERNANGQMQLVSGIANYLNGQSLSAIVAITTPMAQAVAQVAQAPVAFAAVTDPVGAGLVEDLSVGKGSLTGTSDAWPYEAQLALIREILPEARTIGVLYNPGEAPSQYGIQRIRELAPKYGFQIVERAVNTTLEVQPSAEALARNVDALFLSSDNTVISGVVAALMVADRTNTPLFVGDSGTVARGGLAAVSVGYHQLGIETANLVHRLLQGERDIPVVVAEGTDVVVNTAAAQLMGVTLPDAVLARAARIHDQIES